MAMGKGRGDGERVRSRSPSGASAADIRKGVCVKLYGLQGAAHLNGMTGICEDWDEAKGRWIVHLQNGEHKSLKPDNLEAQEPDESDDAQNDDMEDDNAGGVARMASDQDSGFVCCESFAAAQQALEDNEVRIEFGGITDAEERTKCVDFVVELLGGSSRRLRGISFAGCALSASELHSLATALRSGVGSQVSAFGVSKNPGVEQEAWHELFEALPPKSIWLDFGDNKLTDDALQPLVAGLEGREDLDKLYLDGNCLCALSKLCAALPETGVTQLDLGDNAIDDAGSLMIASVLPRTVVTILVLGSNPITDMGVKSLFEFLPRSSLDTLYLDNTGVDDGCLQELASVLKDSKLSELHIDKTKVTDAGVRSLLPHIAPTELTYLDVSGNSISDETIRMLESTVSSQRGGDGLEEEDQED